MSGQKRKNSFVFQAGIMAAAGMLVKVISLIYRSPLLSILGLEGNNYYTAAVNIYTIVLLISSYSIPSAISKVIAQRLALGEYRNVQRVFQCALLYVLVIGGIAAVVTFAAAPYFVSKNPNAATALRVLAPTIFFSGILGVLRGYFQAHSSMLHTSISQVLEQIINAAVSILAAYLLIRSVADQDATTQAIYGSAGSAIGTGAGVLTGLLFMLWMYLVNRSFIHRRVKRDRTEHLESYGEIFRVIFTIVTPFILSTFVYNCSTVVNMSVFYHIMSSQNVDAVTYGNQYGVFATQAVSIVNIPIAIASAMSSATIPTVSTTFARGETDKTREQITKAIYMTMLVAIPAMVGIAVLSRPIMQFIFPQKESLSLASGLLIILSVTVVTYCLSTLTNAILQGIGRVNTPVIHALAALIIQTVGLVLLLQFTSYGVYALAVANILYSLVMCVLNQIAVARHLSYRLDFVKIFIKPGIAAIVMGAVVYRVYRFFYQFLPLSRIVLLVAVVVGAVIYFAVLLGIGGVTETELLAFPKGGLLVRWAKKLHLLREEAPVSKKKKKRKKKRRRRKKKKVVRRR